MADIHLFWRPEDINDEGMKAAGLCQDITDQAALDDCHAKNYGLVVMVVEPEIAGLCRGAGGPDHDIDKMAECAKNKFNANALNGFIPAPPPSTWSAANMSCNAAGADPKKPRRSLRDRLHEELAKALRTGSEGPDGPSDNGSSPGTAAAQTLPTPPTPPPPPQDENEAYCNYMASKVVRGELTFGGGSKIPAECKAAIAAAEAIVAREKAQGYQPFTMSGPETDAQIKRYLGEIEELQRPD